MTVVAIQGDTASFHDIAARQFFGINSERAYCDTFESTLTALKDGTADQALCAIENSLYGSINEVYDLILKNGFFITGEVYLRIEQCLITLPGADISKIKTVYSHPVALAQCEEYLSEHLPEAARQEYHDTAASVEHIKQLGDPTVAAIAGREAAKLYGMELAAPSIETNKQNYTRFVAVSRAPLSGSHEHTKTSLVIETGHTPGALYHALGCFAKRSINLTKIQSRPIIGNAWHYMFYLDVEAGDTDDAYLDALKELASQGCMVTSLGSYQAADSRPAVA